MLSHLENKVTGYSVDNANLGGHLSRSLEGNMTQCWRMSAGSYRR